MRERLERLFIDNYAWLRDRLRKHTASVHAAEDVASEAFVQLAQQRNLEEVREPRALLTTIARRVLFESWRRRDLEQAYLESLAGAPQATYPSAEEHALVVEALMAADAALRSLSAKARSAFLYSQLDGWTYGEIANELKVSASMVRQYMSRALSAVVQAVG
jgi:RNA polymerase sigma-70 factor (ECF subfamily)